MSTIISPDDFRTASIGEYCVGLELSTTEASDDILSATIARATSRVNESCNDSFFGETADEITLDGTGEARLTLPKRCTEIDELSTTDPYGNVIVQNASAYRLHSSLDETGSRRLDRATRDWVEVVPWGGGIQGQGYPPYNPWRFAQGPQNVTIAGSWGWTSAPAEIKRAVALITFDQIKAIGSQTVKSVRWQTAGELYDISTTGPTGIVEVDMILAEYDRDKTPDVMIG